MPDIKIDDNGLFEEERRLNEYLNSNKLEQWANQHAEIDKRWIVRVHYFVRGGFVGHRSRASSKHLSPHLPVGSLDSSGGSNRGCAAPKAARVGVGSTKKPTPDVVVFEK
ncbi:hypothetical protein TNCV_4634531 [Trichonephila clavipes]|nr:hypothetical protein TNCV_4634531 [Trichonephila clavipes]